MLHYIAYTRMEFEMMNAILKNLRHYNVKNEFPCN